MAKRCELTGVGVQYGNNVSHSNRKTRRRFLPNLQSLTLRSEKLCQNFTFRITAATLRSVDHNGGLDSYLLSTSNSNLTELAQKVKRKIKKVATETDTAKPAKKVAAKKGSEVA